MPDQKWNPWLNNDVKPAASADERAAIRRNLDPELADICGPQIIEEAAPSANDDFINGLDAAFRYQTEVPPLTPAETQKAVTELSRPRYLEIRKNLFPQLLQSAETHLAPDSLARRFLKASIDEDKTELREVIRLMGQPTQ
jgi:hypothetical protein